MNILIVTPSISRNGGGVSEAVRLLSRVLARDHQVEILTFRDSSFDKDVGKWAHVSVSSVNFIGPSNYCFSPDLVAALCRRKPDVVHVHGLWMFHCLAVQLVYGSRKKIPIVLTPHGMLESWILERSRLLKSYVSRIYQNRFLRRVNLFHALTLKEVSDVKNSLPSARCLILPNFVDAPTIDSVEKAPWDDARFVGKKIFLFFGRIHEKKGCRELIEAWRRANQLNPRFAETRALVFAGWIDSMDDFELQVQEAAKDNLSIFYVGPQYDADKWKTLRSAYYFILPSKSEGLPMAVLEAWGMGLPVMMTRACNLPEGFEYGAALEIGTEVPELVCDLQNLEKISDEQYNSMSHAARKIVKEKYSASYFLSKIDSAYKELVDEKQH